MSTRPLISTGGLVSGLDTNAIVDALVKAEQAPISMLQSRQAAFKARVSVLGDLASKVSALATAATSLGESGALALKAQTSAAAFSVSTTTGGTAGRFSVQVGTLAAAAKARSVGFGSAFDGVTGGTLSLTVMGTTKAIAISDGMTLKDVAAAINTSGAGVSATLISTGSQTYLSLTNRDTGYPLSGVPGDALSISESSTGILGKPLGLALTQSAANAQLTVDGLPVTRQSNEVTDVLPGATLSLKATSGAPEDVVLTYDVAATQANLQKFVTAYNDVVKALQKQLTLTPDADRERTLAGDSVARSLQQSLQRVISTAVPALGTVRSLADLGVKTARDGSLSIKADTLSAAIARQPSAVDQLFTTATTGLGAVVSALGKQYTDSTSGLLTQRAAGLTKNIDEITAQTDRLQARLDSYRQNLVRQFTAMESVVSGLKSIGSFLANNGAFTPINGSK